MKKVCFIAIALLCSIAASAQQFLSAKEMLKMMSREYAAACQENCTAEVMSVGSNASQGWVEISNAKVGQSTCVSIYYLPGDMDVYRVETIVYGKDAAQGWMSQLRDMGFKTAKTDSFGNDKEWQYKKIGEDCVFTLHYSSRQNEYNLIVFNPNNR